MQTGKANLIVEMTFELSLDIISFTHELEKLKKYVLANQLFKAVTSIGANVGEVQNAETKNDFIHKMKIAAKEADETEYWLLLCQRSSTLPDTKQHLEKITSIHKVLSKIIASSKNSN